MKRRLTRPMLLLLTVCLMVSVFAGGLLAAENEAPAAPENLEIIYTDTHSVFLIWQPNTDLDGYFLYRMEPITGEYRLVQVIDNPTTYYYDDMWLKPGATYSYKLSAYREIDGATHVAESALSAAAVGTTKGISARSGGLTMSPLAPDVPVGLRVTGADASSITLRWFSVNDATSYVIYRCDTIDGQYDIVGTSDTTTFTNTSLTPSTGYYYKVAAVSYGTPGEPSIAVYGTTTAEELAKPKAPVAVAQSSSAINVSWETQPNASLYILYGCTTPDGNYTELTRTSNTSYPHGSLQPNTPYYYKIVYMSGLQTSPLSDYGTATTFPLEELKVTVTAAGTDKLNLSWNQITGATGYTVYRYISGSYLQIGTTPNLTYPDSGLTANTTYYYKVVANTGIEGYGSGKTDNVQVLTVTVKTDTSNSTRLNVSWNPITGANSYTVYRLINGSYQQRTVTSTLSYIDTGLAANTTYTYRVVANTGQAGVGSGKTAPSTESINVQVQSAGTTQLVVAWTKATSATSYKVYRLVNGSYQLRTSTSTQSYIDSGLNQNTQYTYKIVANTGAEGVGTGKTDPVQPLNVTVTSAGSDKLIVSWNRITGASSYSVYRLVNGSYQYLVNTASLSHPDSGLAANTTYTYRVVANTGQAGVGSGKTDIQQGPAKPYIWLTSGEDSRSITLRWAWVKTWAPKYKLYISEGNANNFVLFCTFNTGPNPVTGELYYTTNNWSSNPYYNLQIGKTYYYKVVAVDAQGRETSSDIRYWSLGAGMNNQPGAGSYPNFPIGLNG